MNDGRIEQVGAAAERLRGAGDVFVADFLGVSNLMDATRAWRREPPVPGRLGDFELVATRATSDARGDAQVTIRPERVSSRRRSRPARTASPAWSSGSSTSATPSR